MSTANNGGPAFPRPVRYQKHEYGRRQESIGWVAEGGEGGLTIRDYFMAHAPAEPQPWFNPVMAHKRPPDNWQGDDGKPYESARQAESECGDCYSNVNEADQDAWDAEHEKQRYIQWPAAWADAMLKAREAVKQED